MKCSICGTPRPYGAERCPTCGCRFREDTAAPPKSRRRSGCGGKLILLTAFILAGYLLGNFSYVSTERIPAAPEPQTQTAPVVPAAAENCFAIAEGTLMFLPDRYEGGPVLQVPEIVAGQAVTDLGPGCFAGCTELTTILLPDTIRSIGAEAFAGCENLRGLFVPKSTEWIGKKAFAGCISLESIYIPATMESIAEHCFDDCAALIYIFYEGYYESWDRLYDDFITPFTGVFCLDGDYYHAAGE